jgi:hypothetical protein
LVIIRFIADYNLKVKYPKQRFEFVINYILVILAGILIGSVANFSNHAFGGGAIVDGGTSVTFAMIKCSTDQSGLRETHGFYFSAHARNGILQGHWDFASQFTGVENKGGYIYDGKSDGKTYELKGKETQDGICNAKVPKDVIISGNCGKDVTINYKTINGLSHTLTGDVKCLGATSQ